MDNFSHKRSQELIKVILESSDSVHFNSMLILVRFLLSFFAQIYYGYPLCCDRLGSNRFVKV